MIRIFIGYDKVESVAWHVLAHSIISRSGVPIAITPIGNETIASFWARDRGEHDSTDFSNARWAIPALCDYQGHAIFMDCDMVVATDIWDLWSQQDDTKALVCTKHNHQVEEGETKFLGAKQAAYARKNYSSLMVINCAHPYWQSIDPENDPGLDLHQFVGLDEDEIGELEGSWNVLLKPGDDTPDGQHHDLAHFTWGGPWHGWTRYWETNLWCNELRDMLGANNPAAHVNVSYDERGVYLGGAYHVSIEDEEAETRQAKKEG